jgi:GGDEF domain-containing protein
MNLRQITSRGKSDPAEISKPADPTVERTLTHLADGAASNMLAINASDFNEFRGRVSQLALQMRDGLPEPDRVALIGQILHEFQRYRSLSEEVIKDRISGWRTLVSKLLVDLLTRTGLDPDSADAAPLVRRVPSLLTAEELNAFLVQLTAFFRLGNLESRASRAAQLAMADRSTANDNASGLRGGGAAVEHVRRMMDRQIAGYAVLFQLNCLDTIGERFGMEAIQDSLMAVSAFLTHSLRSDDAIYHWSDSSLLAVLQTPVSAPILTAAMRRIVDNNRDITIQIGGRTVMLRIPLEFEITATCELGAPEDLNKLTAPSARRW